MDVSTLYNGCNYISMLGLKLIHVNKRIPWYKIIFVLTSTNWRHISCTSSINFDWWAEWLMKKHCLVAILWNVAEHQMYKHLSHINSSKAKFNLLIWIPSTKTIIWNMWSYMFWARWWPDATSSYKKAVLSLMNFHMEQHSIETLLIYTYLHRNNIDGIVSIVLGIYILADIVVQGRVISFLRCK